MKSSVKTMVTIIGFVAFASMSFGCEDYDEYVDEEMDKEEPNHEELEDNSESDVQAEERSEAESEEDEDEAKTHEMWYEDNVPKVSCDICNTRLELLSNTDASGSTNTGALEIGSSSSKQLRLDNNEIITDTNGTLYLQHGNNGDLRIDSTTLAVDASANRVGMGNASPIARLHIDGYGNSGDTVFDYNINHDNYISFGENGFMRIRTYDPGSHTYDYIGRWTSGGLRVAGVLQAQEIVVSSTVTADYVFEDDYELMSLDDLEDYIEKNNHLPNVPNQDDVSYFGKNIGETQTKLLEKIEELTLHLIDQNKKIKELERKISEGNK